MGRTATELKPLAAEPAINENALEVLGAKSTELVHLQAEQAQKATAVARQIGYEGTLTVGTLEDEIRFYQRRSVESLLEAGKRLLVLRELCQFGTEFDQRVELLGFSRRTAYRFMQAAAKVAQSSNLLTMSTQVKNASAFLELITHDEEVLDGLQEMDDFDRMSASQLRDAARELQADKAATEQLLTAKNKKIDELSRKVKKFDIHIDLPEAFRSLHSLAGVERADAAKKLQALKQIGDDAMSEPPEDPAAREVHEAQLAALSTTLRDAYIGIQEELERTFKHFNETIGMFLPD